MSTTGAFLQLLKQHGSDVLFHRDDSPVSCPCRTKQGYRDPIWHLQHPAEPQCNEAGMLPDAGTTLDINLKAFVHPVQSGAVRRLTSEQISQVFGEIRADDHLGIFPVYWNDIYLEFYNWGQSTEDYIRYGDRDFTVVSANMIPDPSDGSPWHHWEVGLRYFRG